MAYSAMAVANAFIKLAKEGQLKNLSPMKLQKLLFFAQSWRLAQNDEPLIDDFFCRWQYGPVIPSLYHEFKEYGARPISAYGGHFIKRQDGIVRVHPIVGDSDTDTWDFLGEIVRVYGGFSGSQLSAMTHEEGSAWSKSGDADGGPIENDDLKECIYNSTQFSTELN